ncbi:FAD/NAD(P)-binding domain-containing protein [Myriangium duriaei CBS 260.36]|uniref:FAD/NAD(P)-binding domain-containing protein n=1 Tax=Myriangium duriaei CBS 260.36 TaxID=1168546 RepID=A0A9P4J4D3_9PEZI|nr:FAD/NAD(P)-binding domain-containing protein [Myriangium duriaei CBS 260.36]
MPLHKTQQLNPAIENPSSHFDMKVLQQKYQEERDKRLRHSRGLNQYRTINGEFSHMLRDPFAVCPVERAISRDDHCDVVIIGGGYGAQLMAIELLKVGIHNIRIIEKGTDFGGTWYWNRYPGAQCDIESYVYMPLLDDTGYIPSRKYAGGRELLRYSHLLGEKYGLYEHAYFQTEVHHMTWNDCLSLWRVETDRGDEIHARFVIPAAGPLHHPKLPDLPGLGSFQGHTFHTSRWDFDYTGGHPTDDPETLWKLQNKRVGVIGTGATAVQIIPHLGQWAEHLYVFQRTPSSIDVRNNQATDPNWVMSLNPGWHETRKNNFNTVVNGGRAEVDLVADAWTDTIGRLTNRGAKRDAQATKERRQQLDFEKMEQVRHRVDTIVQDPETAEKLKPWYNQFCKRPCFHDEYLPVFNRPNVSLIDTQGVGVERITPSGVVAGGKEFNLDCLIFATGFQLYTDWTFNPSVEVQGRNGLRLASKWADGMSTFHGHSSRGFPNFFFIQNAQAAISPNFLHVTGFQGQHISYIIKKCLDMGATSVEPTQEAEDAWVREIIQSRAKTREFRQSCTPGYYNHEGESSKVLSTQASHGEGALAWMEKLRNWRKMDDLNGLELHYRYGNGSADEKSVQ